jgi:hypothetical protein
VGPRDAGGRKDRAQPGALADQAVRLRAAQAPTARAGTRRRRHRGPQALPAPGVRGCYPVARSPGGRGVPARRLDGGPDVDGRCGRGQSAGHLLGGRRYRQDLPGPGTGPSLDGDWASGAAGMPVTLVAALAGDLFRHPWGKRLSRRGGGGDRTPARHRRLRRPDRGRGPGPSGSDDPGSTRWNHCWRSGGGALVLFPRHQ